MEENKMVVTVTFIIASTLLSMFALIPAYYMHKNYMQDQQARACYAQNKSWEARDIDPAEDSENIIWECK